MTRRKRIIRTQSVSASDIATVAKCPHMLSLNRRGVKTRSSEHLTAKGNAFHSDVTKDLQREQGFWLIRLFRWIKSLFGG